MTPLTDAKLAELEQLAPRRFVWKVWQAFSDALPSLLAEVRASRASRAEIKDLREVYKMAGDAVDKLLLQRESARAERDELREVLRQAIDFITTGNIGASLFGETNWHVMGCPRGPSCSCWLGAARELLARGVK